MAKVEHIIEALGRHKDPQSVHVLKDVGTNSSFDFVREQTARTLVRKNTHESLRTMIINEGKGINDLSPQVSEATVQEILELNNKEEVLKILEDTVKMHSNEEIKKNANSLQALLALSN